MSFDQAKLVYRTAIDEYVSDDAGSDWWARVSQEMHQVCAATSVSAAAAVIEWWHQDWSVVGDSAIMAALRIRTAAKIF